MAAMAMLNNQRVNHILAIVVTKCNQDVPVDFYLLWTPGRTISQTSGETNSRRPGKDSCHHAVVGEQLTWQVHGATLGIKFK
jgi:hypothetical protein